MKFTVRKTLDQITPSIRRIISAIGPQGRRQVLLYAGKEFLRQAQTNFHGSVTYRDGVWPPLSTAYAKRVKRKNATLFVSGNLYRSIKMNSPRSNYVEIYSDSKYAAAHTFGSPRTRLPKRNFWPIQFASPNYARLLFNSERDMIYEIGKRFNIQSGGELPRLSPSIRRSAYSYGNLFTPPTAPDNP